MWLLVENGSLINLDLISRVEANHQKKQATLYEGGILAVGDSSIAYNYFNSKCDSRANWESKVMSVKTIKTEAGEKQVNFYAWHVTEE